MLALSVGLGQDPAIVNSELGKVSEDREGQLGAPGIAAQLVGGDYAR